MNMTRTIPLALALAASMLAASAALSASAADQRVALEVVAGQMKAGGNMDALRKADQAVAALIAKQPGFISRETGAGPKGEWFVIVHWASLKDAENSAAVFMKSPEGQAAMSLFDQNTMLFKHYIKEP